MKTDAGLVVTLWVAEPVYFAAIFPSQSNSSVTLSRVLFVICLLLVLLFILALRVLRCTERSNTFVLFISNGISGSGGQPTKMSVSHGMLRYVCCLPLISTSTQHQVCVWVGAMGRIPNRSGTKRHAFSLLLFCGFAASTFLHSTISCTKSNKSSGLPQNNEYNMETFACHLTSKTKKDSFSSSNAHRNATLFRFGST